MFEQPNKQDIDYALSMLMHEARRQVADEKNRVTSEAIKHGALQSNRVIVIIADTADKIHKASLTQAKRILIDFVQRMERPAPEIAAWARPHLENLSNVVLAGIPPNGFPNDHQRIIRQYHAAFQQRVDGTLREVEIGYVRGSGFSTKVEMSDQEDWISAARAVALLGMGNRSSAHTICKRAHAGLIRARAERFIRDGRSVDNIDVPAEFWWAEGNETLKQNWKTGDFDTWIDRRIHLQAFGVSFLRSDIEKLVPSGLSQQSTASNAPVGAKNGHSAIILTALDVETRAVLRHLTDVNEQTVRGTVFHVGQFEQWRVAVAECGEGNASAASTAERGMAHFHPEVALFVGVAGGVKDVTIGDAVVASKVYGYERGKDTGDGFKARPAVNLTGHALEQRARALRLKIDWQRRLDPEIQHPKPQNIRIGAIAAGEKVIASSAGDIAVFLKEHYGDTLAVEMEGQGFLTSVHVNAPVQGCVIRGISDLLDGKAEADKAGSQERAADVASAVAFEMLATLEQRQATGSETILPSRAVAPIRLAVAEEKPVIEKHVESVRRERPFPQAEEKDGPTRFRMPGEALGIRDGAGWLDSGAGSEISLAPGAAVSLRVMPPIDPGRKWTSPELRRVLNQGINLPTLIGPANGLYTIRAEDGVGTCIVYSPEESQTDHATFVFESGEIWAISTFPLKTHPNELFVGEIERMLSEQLTCYAKLLSVIEVQPPYRWIAALTGVKGRELQYPVAPGRMRIPGLGSNKCVADRIIIEGSYDAEQSPTNALMPFFDEIYNKCGMSRPAHLPR